MSIHTCTQTWLVYIRLEYVLWGEATRNNEIYIGVFELHIRIPTHPNLLFLSPKPSSPASWTTGSWIIWEKPAFLFRSIYIKDLFTTITPSMTCLRIFFPYLQAIESLNSFAVNKKHLPSYGLTDSLDKHLLEVIALCICFSTGKLCIRFSTSLRFLFFFFVPSSFLQLFPPVCY